MSRPRTSGRLAISLSTITWGAACWLSVHATALAQPPAAASPQVLPASPQASVTTIVRPETLVLQALRANPATAPYAISVTSRAGQLVLSGTVGTRYIHDVAIRTALAYTASIRDDLRIDTAETYRVAAAAAAMGGAPPMSPSFASYGQAPYYIYPPPLFGRLDDPFFGFEPPLVAYPPWWRAVTAREPINLPAAGVAQPGADPNTTRIPIGSSPQEGYVEMTLDPQGAAVLRGTVPSLADRVSIGQKVAQLPGVTQVTNMLEVGRLASETPPPPPQPDPPAAPRAPVVPNPAPAPAPAPAARPDDQAIRPAVVPDRDDLTRRLSQAMASRPALAGLPIELSVRDGVAYLSGRVPSVYEAMLAFRAAEQTPGVRSVDDRLEFVVPDGERKNPLRDRGRPEDVEPYLTAQIRRQVGDFAHVDQVRVRGDTLEIRGTLIRQDDRPRLDAVLRSMPVLRGFRLEPTFVVD